MPHTEEKSHKSSARRFMQLLGLVMFAVYLVLGLIIIFWNDLPVQLDISRNYRILFGVVLIVYSFFRFTRLIQVRKD
ncbi:MAG TPA: hypothetical protein DIT07_16235 [Sphingobacteriaceae bacterium]|nr:hypothetical protein [Sphingobacteriaceae bacterium]